MIQAEVARRSGFAAEVGFPALNQLRLATWQVDVAVHSADEARALKFERYLKTGSGCAFGHRHFR